jgi:hypothetical protein
LFEIKNRCLGCTPGTGEYLAGIKLRGLGDFSGFNAAGTNFHPLGTTLRKLDTNRLQVWVEPPWRPIVRVRNIVSELRTFAADFATFSHDFYDTSKALLIAAAHRTE